jgi:hypothetical protein
MSLIKLSRFRMWMLPSDSTNGIARKNFGTIRIKLLRAPVFLDVAYVLAALAVMIIMIATLGAFGVGVGLDVFPIGEDNNWIDMLRRGSGADAARLLWAIDHRNPLSPWWYIAARKIILNFGSGLFALRYGIAGVLAISSYYMVVAVASPKARAFALGLAMLVVVWMANRYTEQIIWNFHGALAASLLSVASYAHFLAEGRRRHVLYAISMIIWFIAFATYTIQCGAVLAIVYLAFRHAPVVQSGVLRSIIRRACAAILDTGPYLVLFGLFLLIWQTTMGVGVAESFSLHFSVAGLLGSFREGIWSSDLAQFYARVTSSPDRVVFIASGVTCCIIAFLALQWRERVAPANSSIITLPQLIDLVVVLACIAAPTVALESSSAVWTAGTRWPMIYQLTTPALLLSLLALLLAFTSQPGLLRVRLWVGVVSVAIGLGVSLSLGHNQVQIEITRNEKFVRDSMLRLVSEDFALGRQAPLQVLVMLDKASQLRWRSVDTISPVIARVWLQRDDVSFRLIPWYPAPSSYWTSWWPIRFGPDSEGVSNAKVWGGTVPYQQIRIIKISGHSARRLTTADRADFAGLEVEWNRDRPITLPSVDPAQLCPVIWSADRDVLSSGWSVGERDSKGPVRWTISRSARLTLPAGCHSRSILRVVVAYAISMRNIEHLTLRINGEKLHYRRSVADGNVVYEADVPPTSLTAGSLLNIDFDVDALDTLPGAARQFGVAVRRVELLPTENLTLPTDQNR